MPRAFFALAALAAAAELAAASAGWPGVAWPATAALAAALAGLWQTQARLAHAAASDALTGLLARGAFLARLEGEVARARRTGQPLALVLVDGDSFKVANDQHGHPFGDRVLRLLAAELAAATRPCDATGRLGGEEFALVLPGLDAAHGAAVAERVRTAVRSASTGLAPGFRQTVSLGLAVLEPGQSAAALVAAADAALYAAKAGGRDRVAVAPPVRPTLARAG